LNPAGSADAAQELKHADEHKRLDDGSENEPAKNVSRIAPEIE